MGNWRVLWMDVSMQGCGVLDVLGGVDRMPLRALSVRSGLCPLSSILVPAPGCMGWRRDTANVKRCTASGNGVWSAVQWDPVDARDEFGRL